MKRLKNAIASTNKYLAAWSKRHYVIIYVVCATMEVLAILGMLIAPKYFYEWGMSSFASYMSVGLLGSLAMVCFFETIDAVFGSRKT